MSTGPERRVMRVTPSGALVPCDACDLGIGPGASPPHTCGRSFPERANREGDQALPAAGQQDVFEHVIGLLRARQAVGIKRYGRSLETFNGRDAGRDLVEELLDAVVYADQDRLERAEMVRRLRAVENALRDVTPRLHVRCRDVAGAFGEEDRAAVSRAEAALSPPSASNVPRPPGRPEDWEEIAVTAAAIVGHLLLGPLHITTAQLRGATLAVLENTPTGLSVAHGDETLAEWMARRPRTPPSEGV